MALFDEVRQLCQRLAPLGWREVLLRHGLDLTAANLAAELARPLATVDRTQPGFQDFHPTGTQGITPGSPAKSLLYHALASPAVHPTPTNQLAPEGQYPTLAELDTLENYIYSTAKRTLASFPTGVIVAVFAYQYRVGARSAHGLHADLAYSRTGVARVGTKAIRYQGSRRSFWGEPADGSEGICALGARYGVYLCQAKRIGPDSAVLGGTLNGQDANQIFLIPLHKLFDGSECLVGSNLRLSFSEFHINEKLRRVHQKGGIPAVPGFDINQAPFVRSSVSAPGELLTLQRVGGGSVLVVPTPHPTLVRTASQRNSLTNRTELVRFMVPAADTTNRFGTSLQIPAKSDGSRQAPEYVNIRHEVVTAANGTQTINDLNLLDSPAFANKLRLGGYAAAHFIDDTCDGCLSAQVTGIPPTQGSVANVRSAYSLITAPDFFPLMDQSTIFKWTQGLPNGAQSQFSQGSPEPLSRGRTSANPTITRPGGSVAAFIRSEKTMTAVVSLRDAPPFALPAVAVEEAQVSFLPDGCSNVFAPGWDISLGRDSGGAFHAAYGLGSPFPEDAKLCAALNSFWPAAAPDATRTFGLTNSPTAQLPSSTAQPSLDRELGYHPKHPLVQAGQVTSRPGWDGEFGPFFETVGGQRVVNHASIARSDYVSNTLAGTVRIAPHLGVSAGEMIRRMEALRSCIRQLPPNTDEVTTTSLFLVEVEVVADWATRGDRGDTRLLGGGYQFVFARLTGGEQVVPGDLRRVRRSIGTTHTCQLAAQGQKIVGLAFRQNATPFVFIANP